MIRKFLNCGSQVRVLSGTPIISVCYRRANGGDKSQNRFRVTFWVTVTIRGTAYPLSVGGGTGCSSAKRSNARCRPEWRSGHANVCLLFAA
jgi:hypothetical protein